MFKKILIANRGEIALRVIRACKELGIKTVAVYSEADRDSLHVRFADEEVCIGSFAAADSYLNIPRIISAAQVTGAEALHPGYGFLAENADFVEVCESCSLKFIGPSSEMVRKMGNKAHAREMMKQAGLPVVPGSEGTVTELSGALRVVADIGYPVIIKAAAGGGGKGMRIARDERGLKTGFRMAQAEAGAAFGNAEVYLEKYVERPRHVEFQILGDAHGNIVHLGERDCSIQRRHQKLVEESPSTIMTPELRTRMGAMAVRGAQSVGYQSAGTVEFLVDPEGNFYFMEMNTRIQVEHPVTEFVTEVDLLKEQIRVAGGQHLSLRQDEIQIRGHAIECRINAEDPARGFIPCPGKVTSFHVPGGPGVRVDTHVYAEYVIPPYYDSMVAKLVVHGKTRSEATVRMVRSLDEFVVEGVKTTIPLHRRIMQSERFRQGLLDTSFLEDVEVTDAG
jgi:acetyl-CoA carboxylase biotin carboxylase subunit